MSEKVGQFLIQIKREDVELPRCDCVPLPKAIMANVPKLHDFLKANTHSAREAYALLSIYKHAMESYRTAGAHAVVTDVKTTGRVDA